MTVADRSSSTAAHQSRMASLRRGLGRSRGTGIILIVASLALIAIYASSLLQAVVPGADGQTVEVAPYRFFDIPFDARPDFIDGGPTEVTYNFTVVSGPPVDVYVLTESDYQRYLSGLRPENRSSATYEYVRFVDDARYLLGHYHYVIDNTEFGLAKPNGQPVVVRYDVPGGPGFLGSIQGPAILIGLFACTGIGVALVVLNFPLRHREPRDS